MSRLIYALASLDSCAYMFKNDFAIAISKVAHVIFLLKDQTEIFCYGAKSRMFKSVTKRKITKA